MKGNESRRRREVSFSCTVHSLGFEESSDRVKNKSKTRAGKQAEQEKGMKHEKRRREEMKTCHCVRMEAPKYKREATKTEERNDD